MTVQDLVRRVVKLEETVAELAKPSPRNGAWYLSRAGQFKNDPVYEEIVSRGRAYRKSLRPKPRTKKR
jgi:hypothetical protein